MITLTIAGVPVPKGRHRTALMLTNAEIEIFRSGRVSVADIRRMIVSRIRQHTPSKTNIYENIVRNHARQAMGFTRPIEGAITCRIKFHLPIPKSWPLYKRAQAANGTFRPTSVPDLDNLTKAIKDGMNKVVYRDDSQITDLICTKRYSHHPGVVVTVAEIDLLKETTAAEPGIGHNNPPE